MSYSENDRLEEGSQMNSTRKKVKRAVRKKSTKKVTSATKRARPKQQPAKRKRVDKDSPEYRAILMQKTVTDVVERNPHLVRMLTATLPQAIRHFPFPGDRVYVMPVYSGSCMSGLFNRQFATISQVVDTLRIVHMVDEEEKRLWLLKPGQVGS